MIASFETVQNKTVRVPVSWVPGLRALARTFQVKGEGLSVKIW